MKPCSNCLPTAFVMTIACLLIASSTCLAAEAEVSSENLGSSLEAARLGRIYIAGQPDEAALEHAQEQGISMVINLRTAGESEWDEASAAVASGLQYHHVPIDGRAPMLDFASLARITRLVQDNPDAQVLVHCASGNRAAAWLAVYLAQTEGQDTEQVISTAKQAGLTSEALEVKVRQLLEE